MEQNKMPHRPKYMNIERKILFFTFYSQKPLVIINGHFFYENCIENVWENVCHLRSSGEEKL